MRVSNQRHVATFRRSYLRNSHIAAKCPIKCDGGLQDAEQLVDDIVRGAAQYTKKEIESVSKG